MFPQHFHLIAQILYIYFSYRYYLSHFISFFSLISPCLLYLLLLSILLLYIYLHPFSFLSFLSPFPSILLPIYPFSYIFSSLISLHSGISVALPVNPICSSIFFHTSISNFSNHLTILSSTYFKYSLTFLLISSYYIFSNSLYIYPLSISSLLFFSTFNLFNYLIYFFFLHLSLLFSFLHLVNNRRGQLYEHSLPFFPLLFLLLSYLSDKLTLFYLYLYYVAPLPRYLFFPLY